MAHPMAVKHDDSRRRLHTHELIRTIDPEKLHAARDRTVLHDSETDGGEVC